MRVFKDNEGRSWNLSVDHTSIKRVRATLDVNLLDAVGGDLIERLATDPILLVDVVYVICQPEVEKRELSDEEFGRSMAGEAIDSAAAALMEDLIDFFPNRQRTMVRKAWAKYQELADRTMELATAKLESPQLSKRITDSIDRQLDQAIDKLELGSSGPSTGGPSTSLQG